MKIYNLPTLQSETAYVNENKGFLTSQKARIDLLEAIDVQGAGGRRVPGSGHSARAGRPKWPAPSEYGRQDIPYDPDKLKALVKTLPSPDRSFIVGYDTGAPDDQLLAEDIGIELDALGLNTKVVGYETSQIFRRRRFCFVRSFFLAAEHPDRLLLAGHVQRLHLDTHQLRPFWWPRVPQLQRARRVLPSTARRSTRDRTSSITKSWKRP